jgi:hypothetical protein
MFEEFYQDQKSNQQIEKESSRFFLFFRPSYKHLSLNIYIDLLLVFFLLSSLTVRTDEGRQPVEPIDLGEP